MSEWKWLEHIEETNNAFKHWHEKMESPNLEDSIYPTIHQLIACIKEMREVLEQYQNISAQRNVSEGSYYSLAAETLVRCAKGQFNK